MQQNAPLTKAEFDAGIATLREYIDGRITETAKRLFYAQQIGGVFQMAEKIRVDRDVNPNGYREEDVERLLHEVRAEQDSVR